jgi:hypothetical protein
MQTDKLPTHVTEADIEASIGTEHYFTAAQGVIGARAQELFVQGFLDRHYETPGPLALMTFCVIIMKNGFVCSGRSSSATAEVFTREKGRQYAREEAVKEVSSHLAFMLKNEIARANQGPPP